MSDDAPTRRDTRPHDDRPTSPAVGTTEARTSAAAVFGLLLGLVGLLAALTGLLAPVAIVVAALGLVLSLVGVRAARRPMVAGRAVAISGLLLSVVALVLAIITVVGVATVVSNNPQLLDQIARLVDDARNRIPRSVPGFGAVLPG